MERHGLERARGARARPGRRQPRRDPVAPGVDLRLADGGAHGPLRRAGLEQGPLGREHVAQPGVRRDGPPGALGQEPGAGGAQERVGRDAEARDARALRQPLEVPLHDRSRTLEVEPLLRVLRQPLDDGSQALPADDVRERLVERLHERDQASAVQRAQVRVHALRGPAQCDQRQDDRERAGPPRRAHAPAPVRVADEAPGEQGEGDPRVGPTGHADLGDPERRHGQRSEQAGGELADAGARGSPDARQEREHAGDDGHRDQQDAEDGLGRLGPADPQERGEGRERRRAVPGPPGPRRAVGVLTVDGGVGLQAGQGAQAAEERQGHHRERHRRQREQSGQALGARGLAEPGAAGGGVGVEDSQRQDGGGRAPASGGQLGVVARGGALRQLALEAPAEALGVRAVRSQGLGELPFLGGSSSVHSFTSGRFAAGARRVSSRSRRAARARYSRPSTVDSGTSSSAAVSRTPHSSR